MPSYLSGRWTSTCPSTRLWLNRVGYGRLSRGACRLAPEQEEHQAYEGAPTGHFGIGPDAAGIASGYSVLSSRMVWSVGGRAVAGGGVPPRTCRDLFHRRTPSESS